MATVTRGKTDASIDALKTALDAYEAQSIGATANLYRQNFASIRVRVVDPRFEGMSKSQRHELVWNFLNSHVDSDTLADISVLLTLAPAELGSSFANFEFDDPIASAL